MQKVSFHHTLLALLLALAVLISPIVPANAATDNDRDTVYEYLKQYHIRGAGLEKENIEAMIERLDDPYTEYYTESEYEAFINQIDGTLVGVGIQLEEKDGAVIVLTPLKNTPAAAAGILPGDRIIAVDGQSVVDKRMNDIVALVRGKEGTPVTLTMQRGESALDFRMLRAKIELPLVEYEFLSTEKIGYIHINSFGDTTFPKLVDALADLQKQGMQSLILDLRGNTGGKVDSVLQVASLFVGEGPVMWVQNGAHEEKSYNTMGKTWWQQPIALLIDKGSASASEVLAGALQDYQLVTVMGETSFGKGVMQSLVELPSGSVLKLTTNEFFSPRKTKIHDVGIEPDIRVERKADPLAYAKEWLVAVSALRNGRAGTLTLEVDKIKSADEWVLHKGSWHVALYRLHGMLGGELSWNQQTRTATYTLTGVKQDFTMGKDAMVVKNDRIYVPITSLKALPNVTITQDAKGNVTLTRKTK